MGKQWTPTLEDVLRPHLSPTQRRVLCPQKPWRSDVEQSALATMPAVRRTTEPLARSTSAVNPYHLLLLCAGQQKD